MTIHPSSAHIVREVARESFSPEPPDVFSSIAARRSAGERVILPTVAAASRPGPMRKRWITIALIGVAGVAAAMPGSPLRRLVAGLFAAPVPLPTPSPIATPPNAPSIASVTAQGDTLQAGVSIPARGRSLWVGIDSLSAPVRVVLYVVDRTELEVRGYSAAASATFRPRADGISVTQLLGGHLRIDVPRQTPAFVLRVKGIELATMLDGRLHTVAGGAGSDSLVIVARP